MKKSLTVGSLTISSGNGVHQQTPRVVNMTIKCNTNVIEIKVFIANWIGFNS
jgi:hypothetical protein